MNKEKQLANQLFDLFRTNRCKAGQGVMLRLVYFDLRDKLNPKDAEKFMLVLNGLLNTEYITFKDESQDFLLLTEKGYNLIYDDEKVSHFLSMPWIIPDMNNVDWNVSYNMLWRVIGVKDECPAYITGPKFYSIASKIDGTIPPSYSQFYDKRKNEGKSLSRVDFFKDILDHMSDELRYTMYAKLQNYIDEKKVETLEHTISPLDDITLIESPAPRIASSINVREDENPMVYVSYSWSQSEEMDDICLALDANSISYKRDKKDCGYRQNIKHFEDEIGSGNIVIAVLSDKYLRSIHCMYELSSLIENGYIEDRLFPIVYIDGHEASSMQEYLCYWTDEYNKRVELISTFPIGQGRVAIDELSRCDTIISNLPKLWSYISRYNTSTPEDIKAEGYSSLVNSIKEKLDS